ncbi:hypothetical protein [Polyangium sp. 6x1]|uniref:hypothetical protein n=1 Tax=Polyangium sp. 6x1 TaxID=3042689 RepID=UPI002482C5D6|nr:hypothetical protein [Polyangium sp. 6x1]MDI1451866.1 hypothetical protein [Polyangium sp. 6x1]
MWNIPPGWLHYAGDTGANLVTARKYVVIKDDWPQKIATKLGACPARVKWWSELKAANPHKPTQSGSGNWASLFAGEEIGIPDVWPEHPLAVPINAAPTQPSTPGVPGPGKTTTLDPSVVPHTQALLANWAMRNPSDRNPSDFGRDPVDLVSGFTPRTTQALASFQTWWNKKQPTRPLPTTGELDQATYNALIEENNASNTPVPWFETAPQQQTTPQQQGQSTGGQTAPQQTSQQQPAPQQNQGTPVITIPGVGTFPLPNLGSSSPSTSTTSQTSTQNQQPASQQWGQTSPGAITIDIPGVGQYTLPPLGQLPSAPAQSTTSPGQPTGVSQTSPGQPTGGGAAPQFDSNLTAAEKAELAMVIDNEFNPDVLDQLADTYESNGHPLTAKHLRERAEFYRALAAEGGMIAEQEGGYGNGSGGYGSSTPSTSSSGSSGGLLPVIAVIGAGLAFS